MKINDISVYRKYFSNLSGLSPIDLALKKQQKLDNNAFSSANRSSGKLSKIYLSNSSSVVGFFKDIIYDHMKEHLFVVFLDSKFRIVDFKVFFGKSKSSIFFKKEKIINLALRYGSKKIIIAHNHPSELRKPSQNDIKLTHEFYFFALKYSLHLIDHIILTSDDYYSFSENNFLSPFSYL